MPRLETTTTGPCLEDIQQLEDSGAPVATGEGTPAQKFWVRLICLYALAVSWRHVDAVPEMYFMLPVTMLAIDFLSGFVHWFFDTQVKPGPTRLGRIAVDFLDHHLRPRRTVDVGLYVSAFRPAVMVTLPLLSLIMLVSMPSLLTAMLFWIAVLAMWVPQTHKLAHMPGAGGPARLLQSLHIMLRPRAHARHHADNAESFCVFTGWLNPVLDRTRFWRGLEWVFRWVRGL